MAKDETATVMITAEEVQKDIDDVIYELPSMEKIPRPMLIALVDLVELRETLKNQS